MGALTKPTKLNINEHDVLIVMQLSVLELPSLFLFKTAKESLKRLFDFILKQFLFMLFTHY